MKNDYVCGYCGSDKPFITNPADSDDVTCSACSAPDSLIITLEEYDRRKGIDVNEPDPGN